MRSMVGGDIAVLRAMVREERGKAREDEGGGEMYGWRR